MEREINVWTLHGYITKELLRIVKLKSYSIRYNEYLDEMISDQSILVQIMINRAQERDNSETMDSLKWKYRHLLPFPIPDRIPNKPIEE